MSIDMAFLNLSSTDLAGCLYLCYATVFFPVPYNDPQILILRFRRPFRNILLVFHVQIHLHTNSILGATHVLLPDFHCDDLHQQESSDRQKI